MKNFEILLKEKEEYSIKEIKKVLRVTSNRECFLSLCTFLNEKLDCFQYNEPLIFHKYWLKLFKYMTYFIEHMNHHNANVFISELQVLNKKVSLLIEKKNITGPKRIVNENRQFLKKIKDNIEVSKEQVFYYEKEDHPDLYDYMKYLILKVKHYEYIYETIKNVPEVVNLKRTSDFSLFETVFIKCIHSIIQKQWDTVIYYEKILHLFVSTEEFDIPYEHHISYPDIYNEKQSYHMHVLEEIEQIWRNKKQEDTLCFLARIYDVSMNSTYKGSFVTKNHFKDSHYEDHTQKRVITIDEDNTRIFDDALCLEETKDGYVLYIYTSDVGRFLSFDHPLFDYGFHRGKNIYLPNRIISAFPRRFAKNTLSLNGDKPNFTFAQVFYFDHHMQLKHFDLKKAIIKVKSHYYFNALEKDLFQVKNEDMCMIEKMYILARKLSERDAGKKSYHTLKEKLRRLDGKISSDNQGEWYRFKKDKRYETMGSQLITEFKILANTKIATLCKDSHFSFMYRAVHLGEDKDKIISMLAAMNKEDLIKTKQKLLLGQLYPYYTTEEVGHDGLERDAYCHALTPITNLVSTCNQFLLEKQIFEGRNLTESEKRRVKNACNYLDQRIRSNKIFAKEYTKAFYETEKY